MIHFDLVGVVVKDMAASLAFYRLLGFEVPHTHDREEHVEVTLPGGIRFAWDTIELIRRFNPEWNQPNGSCRIALAFKCDSPELVDKKFNQLVAAGYPVIKTPWNAFWGQRYAIVCDPDNNAIDLFANNS
jgi:catechol 2,3-dioxygenase-like lactoylglutathione lyase family enzyme